ncbi:MAG: DUF362 domain-containing protein [Acidobacteria bacterium]|jgi:uncharacterized protein (DUF362 family)|nr:DUF362 domain-containing protein [Acidobacteriota bacterium]
MHVTRRTLLTAAGAAILPSRGVAAPQSTRVAVAQCPDYGPALTPALNSLFDQIGGLGRLVKGKTVVIKVNLTGSPTYRLGHSPLETTHYTHPSVIGATVHLMGRAGARRIRIVESPWSTAEPIEEYVLQANWEPSEILRAAPSVEFVNTNWGGPKQKYSRFSTPNGGHIFPGFDLNPAYEECDVFVSLAKMKDHVTTGITLAMKNCFGITPCTIYGTGAGRDEPSLTPTGGRNMFHAGDRQPSKSAPQERAHSVPKQGGARVPRIVADIISARPIHLSIVEGIDTMSGGEGPWTGPGLKVISPKLLVAGLNPVATDAVCMRLMNYDPFASRGTPPFESSDNMLALAEQLGAGTRDPNQIDISGVPIERAKFDFAALRELKKRIPGARV